MSDDLQDIEVEADDERPAWLPSNFKSPEALVASYAESQSAYTQSQQLLREREDELETLLAEQQTVEADRRGSDLDRLAQRVREHASREAARVYRDSPLANTLAVPLPEHGDPGLLAYQAERSVASRHADWPQVRDEVLDVIVNNQHLLPEDFTRAGVEQTLELTGELVRQNHQFKQAMGANMRQMKQNAQTLSGQGTRLEAGDDDEEFFARLKQAHDTGYAERRSA